MDDSSTSFEDTLDEMERQRAAAEETFIRRLEHLENRARALAGANKTAALLVQADDDSVALNRLVSLSEELNRVSAAEVAPDIVPWLVGESFWRRQISRFLR